MCPIKRFEFQLCSRSVTIGIIKYSLLPCSHALRWRYDRKHISNKHSASVRQNPYFIRVLLDLTVRSNKASWLYQGDPHCILPHIPYTSIFNSLPRLLTISSLLQQKYISFWIWNINFISTFLYNSKFYLPLCEIQFDTNWTIWAKLLFLLGFWAKTVFMAPKSGSYLGSPIGLSLP